MQYRTVRQCSAPQKLYITLICRTRYINPTHRKRMQIRLSGNLVAR